MSVGSYVVSNADCSRVLSLNEGPSAGPKSELGSSGWVCPAPWDTLCRVDLEWWLDMAYHCQGVSLSCTFQGLLFSEALDECWGCLSAQSFFFSLLAPGELSINLRELRTIRLGLESLQTSFAIKFCWCSVTTPLWWHISGIRGAWDHLSWIRKLS